MPWLETNKELERMKFIAALKSEPDETFAALCLRFDISRTAGYEWKKRFEEEGPAGLVDRPPIARHHKNATPLEVEDEVVGLRKKYPSWGPKKLHAWFRTNRAAFPVPAPSTIGEILVRRGLSAVRRRRVRVPPVESELLSTTQPNVLWTTDHKGHFALKQGRCYPLTLCDAGSRFLLKCEALTSTSEKAAWPHFVAAFREFGLPTKIRSDNGVPFANARAPGRLSRLSIWWLKLDIKVELIEPGHPEQNGAHERFHLTLDEAIEEAAVDLVEQQRRFDVFRRIYNQDRPHEALGQKTPYSFYESSWRPYPEVVPSPEYDVDMHVRSVTDGGAIKWRGQLVRISKLLSGERVGLREFLEDRWLVYFASAFLGIVTLRGKELTFEPMGKSPTPP